MMQMWWRVEWSGRTDEDVAMALRAQLCLDDTPPPPHLPSASVHVSLTVSLPVIFHLLYPSGHIATQGTFKINKEFIK